MIIKELCPKIRAKKKIWSKTKKIFSKIKKNPRQMKTKKSEVIITTTRTAMKFINRTKMRKNLLRILVTSRVVCLGFVHLLPRFNRDGKAVLRQG